MGDRASFRGGPHPEPAVYVSEIGNPIQPPERITYKIKHKYPNEATLKAVQLFEDKMDEYLRERDWGYVG